MNIRLYLGAVTFPLQVKLWVHTVQMLAKTRVVINGQINFRLFNWIWNRLNRWEKQGYVLCLDAMDQVYDILLLFMYNSFCDWSGLLDRAIKKI